MSEDGVRRIPTDAGELCKLARVADTMLPKLAKKRCPKMSPHDAHDWKPTARPWKEYYCVGLRNHAKKHGPRERTAGVERPT